MYNMNAKYYGTVCSNQIFKYKKNDKKKVKHISLNVIMVKYLLSRQLG